MTLGRLLRFIGCLLLPVAALAQTPPPLDLDGDTVNDSLSVDAKHDTVFVVSGADSSVLLEIDGPVAGSYFGSAAAIMPDLSGDGVPDLVIGASELDDQGVVVGGAYAFDPVTGLAIWFRLGAAGGVAGNGAAFVPDQDYDGVPDILVRRTTAAGETAMLLSGSSGLVLAVRNGYYAALAVWAQAGGILWSAADMNDSGSVNSDDISQFFPLFAAGDAAADLNHDGFVDAGDLQLMMDAYMGGLTTVMALALPPGAGEGSTPPPETVQGSDDCSCSSIGAGLCNGSVQIACPADGTVHPGDLITISAVGTPAGGTYCWALLSGGADITSYNGSSITVQTYQRGDLVFRVRYTYTLEDGTVCSACDECTVQVRFECQSEVDWVLPCPEYAAVNSSVLLEAAGTPPDGIYGWQVATDPPGLVIDTPQGPRLHLTTLGQTGTVTITVGYQAPGCEPSFTTCGFQISADTDGDGIPDIVENQGCTDPNNADTDGDTYDDGLEIRMGSDPCDDQSIPDLMLDTDGDGLSDFDEINTYHSDPDLFDTDDDGASDYAEVVLGLDPLRDRSSGENVYDGWCSLYLAHDQDGDGLLDDFEASRGLNPTIMDADGDNVLDGMEMKYGLDPRVPDQGPGSSAAMDSDGDGLADNIERAIRSNAYNADTDGDGVYDGWEARMNLSPLRSITRGYGSDDGHLDFDGDGLSNADERLHGSDPTNQESDGDGVPDGTEVLNGANPHDSRDYGVPNHLPPACSLAATIGVAANLGGTATLRLGDTTITGSCPGWNCMVTIQEVPVLPNTWYEIELHMPLPRWPYQQCIDNTGCNWQMFDENSWIFSPWPVRYLYDGLHLRDPICGQFITPGEAFVLAPQFCVIDDTVIEWSIEERNAVYWHHPNECSAVFPFGREEIRFVPRQTFTLSPSLYVGFTTGDATSGVIPVMDLDRDLDGMPDYADGLGLFSRLHGIFDGHASDTVRRLRLDQRSPNNLKPLIIQTGGTHYDTASITIGYAASNPLGITLDTDGCPVLPASEPAGRMRLWTGDGTNERDPRPLGEGGMYVAPGTYSLQELGITEDHPNLRLYVEAVLPSSVNNDITIDFSMQDGSDSNFQQLSLTAFSRRFTPVSPTGTLGEPATVAPISHPAPTIDVASLLVQNIRSGADGSLLADVHLTGTVHDSASDLIQGDSGRVPVLGVIMNGQEVAQYEGDSEHLPYPGHILVTGAKQAGPLTEDPEAERLLHPYRFNGEFDQVFTVEVVPGWNMLKLVGTNTYGFSGTSSYTFEVAATAPPDEQVDLVIDTGGLDPAGVLDQPLTIQYRRYAVPSDNPPNMEVKTLYGTGTPGEFVGDGLVVQFPAAYSLDPNLDDSIAVTVTIPGIGVAAEQFGFDETGVATGVFFASRSITEQDRTDWTGYTFAAGVPTLGPLSTGSGFTPSVLELVGGGPGLLDKMDTCRIGDRDYPLMNWHDHVVLQNPDTQLPMLSAFIPNFGHDMVGDVRDPGELMRDPQADAGVDAFMEGFGIGVYDTGVSWKDGIVSLASAAWYCTRNYNIWSVEIRLLRTGSPVLAEDAERISAGGRIIANMGRAAWDLTQAHPEVVEQVLRGDYTGLLDSCVQDEELMQAGVQLVAAFATELATMSDREKGRIVGRIVSEVAAQVVLEVGTGGTAAGITVLPKSATILGVLSKIKNAEYVVRLLKPGASAAEAAGLAERAAAVIAKLDKVEEAARAAEAAGEMGGIAERGLLKIQQSVQEEEGLTLYRAFERYLVRNNAAEERKLVDPGLSELTEKVFTQAFEEAAQAGEEGVSRVPKVRDLEDLITTLTDPVHGLNGRFRPAGMEVHHSTPKYLLRMLIDHAHPGWTETQIDAEFARLADEMPGMLVDRVDHRGKLGEGGFHAIVNSKRENGGVGLGPLGRNGRYPRSDILAGLEDAYGQWGRPDVWQVTRRWLVQQGLAP